MPIYETKVIFVMQEWVEDRHNTKTLREIRMEAQKKAYARLIGREDSTNAVYIDIKQIS